MYEAFEQELKPLDPDVRWELQKIEGYLQMRMPTQARQAMTRLPAALEQTGLLRLVQMHLAFIEENWKFAAHHAALLVKDYPRIAEHWIQWAYASRRTTGLEEAEKILLKGIKYFPRDAVFHYNLGCYASVQGHPEEAIDHLSRAFSLEASFRQTAMDDEDLEPIRSMLDAK